MKSIPASIQEQIDYIKDLDINYRNLHDHIDIYNETTNININVPFDSWIDKYSDALATIVNYIDLNTEEQEIYKFQPKRVSDELYGTTELWHVILVLNECASIINFKPKRLYYYDPNKFKSFINEIMILEDAKNRKDV